MEQNGPKTGKYALTYGALLGAVGVVFGVMIYMMDMLYEKSPVQSIIGIVAALVIIFVGVKNFKKDNEGFLTVKEAIKIGSGAGVIAALISIVYLLVLANVIEPDFWDKSYEVGRQTIIDTYPQMSDEQVDQAIETQKSMKWITYPMMIIMNTLLGLIIGLLSGVILKNKREA
jgi:F0F1-type ATP synthase assembly protein I